MVTSLQSALPAPKYTTPTISHNDDDADNITQSGASTSSSTSIVITTSCSSSNIPPYGQRASWRPRTQADFGSGGAYPECHIAQYPLDMGRARSGGTANKLAIRVDGEGNKRYDAIVKQGLRAGQTVQTEFKDLVPLSQRTDVKDKDKASGFERPSQEQVMSTTERTRLALEALTKTKSKSALTKPNTATPGGKQVAQFIRYTPGSQNSASSSGTQRIIKMTEAQRDPLEPPRHRFKKMPGGPPSPPPPVLRSPPRKVTAQENKDWMIPPAISNWKNNKGYTIPLDKRLAADGSGIKDVVINDNFAQFSEALSLADRHAREEVRQRSIMQQKLAAKEKLAKEEHLRNLAHRARQERAGISSATPSVSGRLDDDDDDTASRLDDSDMPRSKPTGAGGGGMSAMLAGYGSDSDSESGSGSSRRSSRSAASDTEDEGARERDRIREERRRERERELRMSNMGTEQRAKALLREQNRDISEKVALGLAKPTTSKESMTDSRLFNQESLSANAYGDEDSYNIYDKPLFSGSSAAAAIYRRPAGRGGAEDIYAAGVDGDGATTEGIEEELRNHDRFGLGQSKFKSAEDHDQTGGDGGGATRSGPVQFEKDTSDPFAIDQFLQDAKRGIKRSGLETVQSRKKHRDFNDDS
ncbi:probable transcriptional coregulator Snw1 [Melanopsichium pennsylvanicum]|uniref:Pre-mRNA-processing protein 45 n=2 Tax=Melanopsichium pennsylvanicum TaxID=63383 RepID=A0AAJ5C539_9BASI|nr:probable transcriptional coregulator Snw1 [Melanopsichium pennsylvanicum 4]SNX84332.1 probable transcriptional coregulator Snw1 [Melanopsichium pennsylvanicum]